jgi:predicted RNase H-like HicB family nuclease
MIRTDELSAHTDLPAKVERIAGHSAGRELPTQLIDRYIERAILRAEIKQHPDGQWFAEIPHFPGVWASQLTEEATFEELRETLREWVLLKIRDRDRDLPVVDSINLNVL